MKKGKTTYTINKKGYHLLIDKVSAWICEQCGEPYFEGEVVDTIQKIVGELDVRTSGKCARGCFSLLKDSRGILLCGEGNAWMKEKVPK